VLFIYLFGIDGTVWINKTNGVERIVIGLRNGIVKSFLRVRKIIISTINVRGYNKRIELLSAAYLLQLNDHDVSDIQVRSFFLGQRF